MAVLYLGSHLSLVAQSVTISAADEARFEQAMTAIHRGDTSTAEALLKELHLHHPDLFQINESLGLLYAGQDQLKLALPYLQAAAQEQPASEAAIANLGTADLKLGRLPEAVHEFQLAAKLDPQAAAPQEALGQAWMQMREPHKALEAYHTALAIDPRNSLLLHDAALAALGAGDAAEAATLLDRMPDATTSAETQSLYGDVDEKLGKYKDAADHYAKAVQLAPTEANQYAFALEFLRHWTFEAAIKEFTRGVNEFPDSKRMRMGLGIAYFGNASYGQAIPIFAQLLQMDPENSTYADLLGRSCAVLTEGDDPRCAALVKFAEKHSQNGRLDTYAATSILHQPVNTADLSAAERLLRLAMRSSPPIPEASYEMGLLLQRESQWQQSIPVLQGAINLKPDYAAAHYHLALAYTHIGQHEKARTEIALQQKFHEQESKDRDARLNDIKVLLVKSR